MSHIVLVVDGSVVYDSGTPVPTPTPSPTPAPTQPPAGDFVGFSLASPNATHFMEVTAGTTYCASIPMPITKDAAIQFGQGQGLTPTYLQAAVSDVPGGGIGSPAPQGVSGDPNASVSLSWSLNPTVDRGGVPQKAKVTQDKQYFVTFVCSTSGSVSFYWY